MKKFLFFVLAISMILMLVACGENENPTDTSSLASSENSAESSEQENTPSSEEPDVESSEPAPTSSEEEPADTSSEESSEESGEIAPVDDPDELHVADFLTQYVSFGALIDDPKEPLMKARCTDPTSVRVTGVNEGAVDGVAGVHVFNYAYSGKTIESKKGSYDDYAIYVLEYNPETFHYEMTKSYKVKDTGKDSVKIPADGFVLAIHSYFEDYIKAVDAVEKGHAFFPHGFRGTDSVDATIKKKTATVDGKVTESEYGTLVWDFSPDSVIADFAQFDKNDYYSTAKVYLSYDDEYLYIGAVVTSPFHVNPLTKENANSMWQYECIQINTSSVSPTGEYLFMYWDDDIDKKAVEDGVVHRYGFAVNDEGETLSCVWEPKGGAFVGETVCVRDDEKQTTVYEAKIPWAELGPKTDPIEVKKGTDVGVSISINSGNGVFKNILMRDGGGIIGLDDWTKMGTITLG